MARRILVKGASGAGKTTLGRTLAKQLDVPFVELDALHHGPNWTAASATELQARLRAELSDERGWVVDRRTWPDQLQHRPVVRLQTPNDVAAWLADFRE